MSRGGRRRGASSKTSHHASRLCELLFITFAFNPYDRLRFSGGEVLCFPLATKGGTMTVQFARQGIAAMALAVPVPQSSFVRRLLRARDDPAKQRILGWLLQIDDARLRGFGLSTTDITILRDMREKANGQFATDVGHE